MKANMKDTLRAGVAYVEEKALTLAIRGADFAQRHQVAIVAGAALALTMGHAFAQGAPMGGVGAGSIGGGAQMDPLTACNTLGNYGMGVAGTVGGGQMAANGIKAHNRGAGLDKEIFHGLGAMTWTFAGSAVMAMI